MKNTSAQNRPDTRRRILRLTESAVMLALATVLSLVKLIQLPYDGSVTVASAVPLLLVAYRYGCTWGLFTGFAYGLLQIVFSSSLSYVTGLWSVVAVVLLDFGVAFAAVGLAGLFRRVKSQPVALMSGAILYGVVRFLCHVASGATVWAGISIPTAAALVYSVAYNATYMLPETIITAAAAYFLGSVLDFRSDSPVRLPRQREAGTGWLKALAAGLVTAAVVYDVAALFPYMQDTESGEFTVARLGDVSWMPMVILTGVAVLAALALILVARHRRGVAQQAVE